MWNKTICNLRDNKNVIILPADEVRMTVILDKSDYMEKAKQLLNYTTTCHLLDSDPGKQLEKVGKTLKKLQ